MKIFSHLDNQIHSVSFFVGISTSELYLNHPDPNPGDGKDCVRLLRNGQYSDGPCKAASRYICKKNLNTLTENVDCGTYDTGM